LKRGSFCESSRQVSGWECRILGRCPVLGRAVTSSGFRTWRIVYRLDDDAIVIAEVFPKKQQATPARVLRVSKDRLRRYDAIMSGGG